MRPNTFTKDPQAKLEYTWDWGRWLSEGEVIIQHTNVIPAGLTVEQETYDFSSVTIWLSGGTVDTDYVLTCKIVTDQGREDRRQITILVRDR